MQRHWSLLGVLFLGWVVAAHAEGLVDVYRLAEQNDANLRAAAQARLASREGIPQARAQLLPNVALNAGINRDWLDFPGGSLRRDISYTSKNYTLNLSQPLFDRARLVALDQAEGVAR
ncbi:MAG: TolC family protein, partial [Halothiobacillaceae bacterium]